MGSSTIMNFFGIGQLGVPKITPNKIFMPE
jgi:hypothetical protein